MTGTILIFLAAPLSYLIYWRAKRIEQKREIKRKEVWDLEYKVELAFRKLENQGKQRQFDRDIEETCRQEVRRYFEQYKAAKDQYEYAKNYGNRELIHLLGPFIFLRDWNKGIYMIYDDETAKYKEQGSLDKFRNDYFQELKYQNNIE